MMNLFEFSYGLKRCVFSSADTQTLLDEHTLILRPFAPEVAAKVLEIFVSNDFIHQLYVSPCKDDSVKEAFLSLFTPVAAAGGLVFDPAGNALSMTRRDMLDLPKGHIEEGETPENAAIREVQEETGLPQVSIEKPLTTTYHVYLANEQWYIKETQWFKMVTDQPDSLNPQAEEQITNLTWLPVPQLMEKAADTYPTIRHVLNAL
ncbi:MAG: hypothetical protein CSA97_06120 [Bacteroidetes bacterium]|nr:MAG: hypothetical protein CSA97_06120 [Bacteroidota bacterium]